MKNFLSIITVIALFTTSGLMFWAGLAPDSYSRFFGNKITPTVSEVIASKKGQLIINKYVWNVEIVSTDATREKGLSSRQALGRQEGMLFAFDQSDFHFFWMKDMLISLDMIFIDENWKIILIEKNLDSKTFPKTFGGGVKSKYVLEINAGEANSGGLKVGDQIIFLNR